MILLLCVLVLVLIFRRLQEQQRLAAVFEYPPPDAWDIPRENLRVLDHVLGRGALGLVMEGRLHDPRSTGHVEAKKYALP